MTGVESKPGVAGGYPTLTGTGIIAEVVAGRFCGGETIEEIATDYSVPVHSVEQAIRLVLLCRGRNLSAAHAKRRWHQLLGSVER